MRKGDVIFIKNLLVKATAGVDSWQRAITQPLKLNIGINVNNRLRRMALSDDIRRTLNYDSLSNLIVQSIETKPFENIDAAAKTTVTTIQKYLSPQEWATITIDQPKALLLTHAKRIEIATNTPEVVKETLINLHVPLIIGINDLERVCKQEIQLELQVARHTAKAVFNQECVAQILEYVQDSQFLTIESFVNALAAKIYEIAPAECDIEEITVRAAKPSALNLADHAAVQVTRTRRELAAAQLLSCKTDSYSGDGKNHVFLAFGTNQGDRLAQVKQSIDELRTRGIKVVNTSAIYQSEPMYYTDQPQFLNGVFECRTDHDPESLLKALKDIEYNVFDRVKLFDNGPRPMDLDILLFNNEFVETESLRIPHRDMLNRSFVLRPLNDLLPNAAEYNFFNETFESSETTVLPLYPSGYLEFNPEFPHTRPTTLMSIMNATPDSFSDGGDLNAGNFAQTASTKLANGAQILDVGGYSTRPGASEVSVEEEIRRVCTAIREIRDHHKQAVISVDTFRGSVAQAALDAGANMINDVFSGTLDLSILDVAARTGAPIILSHSRGTPETMKELVHYPQGLLMEIATELRYRIDASLKAGCKPWQILLDPGLGFAKTPEQDLQIIRQFRKLKDHPVLTDGLPVLPWLVGPSRKSFIGYVTNEKVPKERVLGTLAVITALRQQGADIVRVHDTREAHQVLQIADAIYS